MKLLEIIDLDPNSVKTEEQRVVIEKSIEDQLNKLKEYREAGAITEYDFNKFVSKFNSLRANFMNQRIREGIAVKKKKETYIDLYQVTPEGYTLVHFDGSISKNPGGLAVGGCVLHLSQTDKRYKHLVCEDASNNVAEYLGIIAALELGLELKIKKLFIKGDSNLIIKQLKGEFVTNPGRLYEYNRRATKLIKEFEHVELVHIKRFFNKEADKYVYSIMKELTKPNH